MGTKKLTRVTHQTKDRTFTKLIGYQANEPRHCGHRALAREHNLDADLAGTDKAPKKNSQVSLQKAVAGVTGSKASSRRPGHRLSDMGDVSDSNPLHRPVADVDHTRPNRVHVMRPRPGDDGLINEQLHGKNEGESPMAATHDGLLQQQKVAVHNIEPQARAVRRRPQLLARQRPVHELFNRSVKGAKAAEHSVTPVGIVRGLARDTQV